LILMDDIKRLEAIFNKHNCTDYKWINPQDIVTAQWVRIKCMYGCGDYGKIATCPPNVPSVSECRQFFDEYEHSVIFHFEKAVDKPEDRFQWTRKINLSLLGLERDVFLFGYQKSFVLVIDSCTLCEECVGGRGECKNPKLSRPTPEAMAIDVYSTARKHDYPIQVLADYSKVMNRYAFLLIE
jgi:predicted metal-binding protein